MLTLFLLLTASLSTSPSALEMPKSAIPHPLAEISVIKTFFALVSSHTQQSA